MCPGTTCFKIVASGKFAFHEIGESEIVGFISCGVCPGKKSVTRTKLLIERGAEAIAFASCMFKGTPIALVCPFANQIVSAVTKQVDENISIFE